MHRHGPFRTVALAVGVIAMGWTTAASAGADDATMREKSRGDAMQPSGSNWIAAENQPCQVYNPYPEPGESVTWSGECVDGRAEGEGELVWRSSDGGTKTYVGRMRAGKFHPRVRCPILTATRC